MPDSESLIEGAEPAQLFYLPATLQAKLEKCTVLPSMPAAVVKVLEVARRTDAGFIDYARAIENDPALTLRLLSLANSAFYSRQQVRIRTCYEAVSRIGLDATLAAVLSFGLARMGKHNVCLKRLWRRAVVAALASRYVARQICPVHSGTLFTMALLQDIGVLALVSISSEDAECLYCEHFMSHHQIDKREKTLFGCDHATVGAWLGQHWGLPDHLVKGIAESHGPLVCHPADLLCLRLSGRIADAWLCDNPVKGIATLIRQFKRTEGAEAISIDQLLSSIHTELPEMAALMEVDAPAHRNNEQMLHEAQQHLFHQTLVLSERLDQQQSELEFLRQRQDALEALSRQDALTKLANRAWLEEQLQKRFVICQQQQRTMSIAFIDLDHFKQLNDKYGHQVGDKALERFGALLETIVREGDLAGRYGGEEFLVVLPDEEASGTQIMVERLIHELESRPIIYVEDKPVFITVSVGIACLSDDDFVDIRELIDVADQCMYQVKRSGRSGVAVYHR
ncbi:sensor domain-containing diguanylate cyclase [Halomonas sp. LS-001]